MLSIRSDFPFFNHHPDLVYLDSASTTHKPQVVIDAIIKFYSHDNANSGRASYPLATTQTTAVAETREVVREFLGAESCNEIIFTSGATAAFNHLVWSLANHELKDGDEILYCPLDHISFITPIKHVVEELKKRGVFVNLIPYTIRSTGGIDIDDIKEKITPQTKVIWATHVHNIFGSDSVISELRDLLDRNNTLIVLDATQSVGHIPVNVQLLKVDALVCAGHKMLAGTGIGILYLRESIQERIPPLFSGSGEGYEVGTHHLAGITSLRAAINYLNNLSMEAVHQHLSELTQYALTQLRTVPNILFTPGPHFWNCKGGNGIISFKLRNIPATEVGFILAEHNICVRTGNHCTFATEEYSDTIRISIHIYNTTKDIDRLISILKTIAE